MHEEKNCQHRKFNAIIKHYEKINKQHQQAQLKEKHHDFHCIPFIFLLFSVVSAHTTTTAAKVSNTNRAGHHLRDGHL